MPSNPDGTDPTLDPNDPTNPLKKPQPSLGGDVRLNPTGMGGTSPAQTVGLAGALGGSDPAGVPTTAPSAPGPGPAPGGQSYGDDNRLIPAGGGPSNLGTGAVPGLMVQGVTPSAPGTGPGPGSLPVGDDQHLSPATGVGTPQIGTGSDPAGGAPAAGALTWDQMLAQANQHATANSNYGHNLDDAAITTLLQRFGGSQGASGTAAGLQPVLDYIDQYKGGAVSGAPSAPGVSTPPPAAATPGGTTNPAFDNTIRQKILDRIGIDTTPASLQDPALNAQFSAFSTLQNQGQENAKSQLAERLAASGQLHGGMADMQNTQLGEDMALKRASYGAGLVGDENKARRGELGSLLGLGTSNGLGQDDLALRDKLGTGQLNLGTLSTLLGTQNSHDLLNYYYTQMGGNMNRDLLLQGLLGQ